MNLDQKTKKALRFLSKNPIGYPSASDPKGLLPGQFGVDTMPTSYLIDREGVIRAIDKDVKVGSAGQDIAKRLEALGFGRRASTPEPVAPTPPDSGR